ncbi:MAG: hypothetical protein AAF597_14580 [Bacteroidota bacterium]
MKRANIFQTICYLAILVFAFPACTSVETLVESGNYEETIRLAQRRLTGKQKKSPKLVAALEEAFNKVTARDMQRAKALAESGTTDWGRVYDIYANIDRRQQALQPILPLVDKRGYQAQFRFAKVGGLLANAADNASAQLYADGLRALTDGRAGDKAAARSAYNFFSKIDRYNHNYRDSYQLIREAEALGVVYIAVEMANNTGGYLPRGFENELLRVRTSNLDDKWRVYDFNRRADRAYDYNARILIENIQVSPDRISERTYIDEREITDGEEYVLDANGNVAKDSLGNDITRPRQIIIRADVLEVYQTKSAIVTGSLVLYDNFARRVVDEERLTAEAIFENYASTFRGDRRALSTQSRRRIGNQPLPFPSNEALILDAAEVLKPQLTNRLAGSYRSLAR